jgi:hypothetical protein
MRIGSWIACGMLCVLLVAPAWAQETGGTEAMDPAMKAWMDAATPGAAHQHLADMVGEWDTLVKSWMDPLAPPMESKGTSDMSMVLGGRYLLQQFHGEMMGQPFEGMGYTGYDNVQKKYVATWMDNMSTGIMTSVGTEDAETKKVTYIGKMWDAVTGTEMTVEEVVYMVAPDHHVFEMYMPGPDGKQMKSMEIHYTRAK